VTTMTTMTMVAKKTRRTSELSVFFDIPGERYCARDLHRGSLKLHIVKKHLGGDDDVYDEGVHAKMYVKKGTS
jgi:hypothetical protein